MLVKYVALCAETTKMIFCGGAPPCLSFVAPNFFKGTFFVGRVLIVICINLQLFVIMGFLERVLHSDCSRIPWIKRKTF